MKGSTDTGKHKTQGTNTHMKSNSVSATVLIL
jgi:hypothetical protein